MLKNLIVSLSFAGMGIVLYLVVQNLKLGFKTKGWERRINFAYASARLGFVIVVGLITEAIFGTIDALPWTWRTGLYILGLAMVAGGYMGIAVEWKKEKDKWKRKNV